MQNRMSIWPPRCMILYVLFNYPGTFVKWTGHRDMGQSVLKTRKNQPNIHIYNPCKDK